MKRREFLCTSVALGLGGASAQSKRLNILWIVAEDVSQHLGCYGEAAVRTPHLDMLAAEGVRFQNAFVTCPVCSSARSALVTGMYHTTIGSHNHRSQRDDGRDGGSAAYQASYRLPASIALVGDLFRSAGYYVCNGRGPAADRPGKTDYNFTTAHDPYDGSHWRDAPAGTPFFAQIQLSGGKARTPEITVDEFSLPPYYPDDPVIRQDWSEYLGSVEAMDAEVGRIVQQLKDAGVYDNTLIVFLSDHGVSHARGKQFLYEEGIRVPMIMRFPGAGFAGTTRNDLALHIDLVPTCLALAGMPVPDNIEGRDLFSDAYRERPYVVCGRDRCDETLDTIRCVRTAQYKYIRNFQSFRAHAQHNQYKDRKEFVQRLRRLYEEGALTPLQNKMFTIPRPVEELYDLEADPHETTNLAEAPEHQETLTGLRETLYAWMADTGDPGLIPEPIIEELGREHGSKYAAMKQVGAAQTPILIETIEAGERRDREALRAALGGALPAQRYWAATWLGIIGDDTSVTALEAASRDDAPTVRIAACLALCLMGQTDQRLPELASLIDHPNVIVGMYAMDAIDQTGVLNATVRQAAEDALASPYDLTQRLGRRLIARLEGNPVP